MKKYFITGTRTEVHYGDTITFDGIVKHNDGNTHKHIECEVAPDNIQRLLDEGVLEEWDVPVKDTEDDDEDLQDEQEVSEGADNDINDKEDEEDECCDCIIDALIKNIKGLYSLVEKQGQEIEELQEEVVKLKKLHAFAPKDKDPNNSMFEYLFTHL